MSFTELSCDAGFKCGKARLDLNRFDGAASKIEEGDHAVAFIGGEFTCSHMPDDGVLGSQQILKIIADLRKLDDDTTVPPRWREAVENELERYSRSSFGAPDKGTRQIFRFIFE
jgi:hypothetical protein